jgi:excisionase family DNA binding protein
MPFETANFLTTEELAKLLKVTPKTIVNWRIAKVVPFFQVGHVIRYDASRVLAALERHEVKEAANVQP